MVAVIFSLLLLAVVSDVTLMFSVKFSYKNSHVFPVDVSLP